MYFLLHVQLRESPNASSNQIVQNNIYSNFVKSYEGLDKVCGALDLAEGNWIGLFVDHYSQLLTEYAELADAEIKSNPFQAKQNGIDLTNMSENQKLEAAQSLMERLFRNINKKPVGQGQNQGQQGAASINAWKMGACFLALQIIKVQFALNKYKSCDRFFSFFENTKNDKNYLFDPAMMPKTWRVNVAFYRGRYNMYNNNFGAARVDLTQALSLCHADSFPN